MNDRNNHDEETRPGVYRRRCKPDPHPPERDDPPPVTAGDFTAGRLNLLCPSFRRSVPANEIEFESRGFIP